MEPSTKTRPQGRRPGRKCKLTPDVQRQIVNLIRKGAFAWVAAQAAGIGPRTFHRWMEKGEAGEKPFRQFRREVQKAAAHARARAEVQVRKVNPLAWLRYGPGRHRSNEQPGWTERLEYVTEPEPPPAPTLIKDHEDAIAAMELLKEKRRQLEAERNRKRDQTLPGSAAPLPDWSANDDGR